jgi:hypothetical protein
MKKFSLWCLLCLLNLSLWGQIGYSVHQVKEKMDRVKYRSFQQIEIFDPIYIFRGQ